MESFEVKSGKIVCSDPCYNRQTWCANFDLPAKNGKWIVSAKEKSERHWGTRVASFEAWHSENRGCSSAWETLPNEIGVDSGQAGIFCSNIYPTGEDTGIYDDLNTFYGKCCAKTLEEPFYGVIDNSGFVSSSGFGDGGYEGECIKKDGEIVAVRVVFIEP
jgi:hypothetical protein